MCQPYIENYIDDEEPQEFQDFVGLWKALPELGWTHKCKCRLEI